MLMASAVGEVEALRLHATELLLMLGTAALMALEPPLLRGEMTTDAEFRRDNVVVGLRGDRLRPAGSARGLICDHCRLTFGSLRRRS